MTFKTVLFFNFIFWKKAEKEDFITLFHNSLWTSFFESFKFSSRLRFFFFRSKESLPFPVTAKIQIWNKTVPAHIWRWLRNPWCAHCRGSCVCSRRSLLRIRWRHSLKENSWWDEMCFLHSVCQIDKKRVSDQTIHISVKYFSSDKATMDWCQMDVLWHLQKDKTSIRKIGCLGDVKGKRRMSRTTTHGLATHQQT